MDGLPENLPELEEPCPICILTKATKISRVPTTDVSKFAPGFMLQMDFSFFNLESIHGFTSTFVAIYSATSYPFGFPSRSKRPPLDILKFLFTKLINQDKKVAFIRVDEDGALARSSEFMRKCHNMNIIVQTTGGRLLLYGNPKGHEVAEHIATKVEVNPRMLSTLENAKSI